MTSEIPSLFDRLKIIIDTREQTPWSFPVHLCAVARGTLRAGDYALDGDNNFAIERKSLDDFIGTISTGWERFKRELGRMNTWIAKVVIVEGDFSQCCFKYAGSEIEPPQHNHPMIPPGFVCSRIATLTMMRVSVLFAGNPGQASALAYQILKKRMENLNETDNDN